MMNGPAHEEIRAYEGELAAGRMTAAERRSWWEVWVEVVPARIPTSNFTTGGGVTMGFSRSCWSSSMTSASTLRP